MKWKIQYTTLLAPYISVYNYFKFDLISTKYEANVLTDPWIDQ